MAKWDQDIQRIHEIRQLLECRKQYFSKDLHLSNYKLDRKGNPLLRSGSSNVISENGVDPSLGRSVEAHCGSFGSDEPSHHNLSDDECNQNFVRERKDSDEVEEESSPEISLSFENEVGKKEQTLHSKNASWQARMVRTWVTKNVAQVTYRKSKENGESARVRESVKVPHYIRSQKSVSFDENTFTASKFSPVGIKGLDRPKFTKKADPIDLLKSKSKSLQTGLSQRFGSFAAESKGKSVASLDDAEEESSPEDNSLKSGHSLRNAHATRRKSSGHIAPQVRSVVNKKALRSSDIFFSPGQVASRKKELAMKRDSLKAEEHALTLQIQNLQLYSIEKLTGTIL